MITTGTTNYPYSTTLSSATATSKPCGDEEDMYITLTATYVRKTIAAFSHANTADQLKEYQEVIEAVGQNNLEPDARVLLEEAERSLAKRITPPPSTPSFTFQSFSMKSPPKTPSSTQDIEAFISEHETSDLFASMDESRVGDFMNFLKGFI